MTEITPFEIYLIMSANKAIAALICMVVASIAGVILSLILCDDRSGSEYDKASNPDEYEADNLKSAWHKRNIFRFGFIGIVFAVCATALPTTKTLVAMYGVPAAIKAATDLKLDDTAKKSIQAVNKLLDGYLKDQSND